MEFTVSRADLVRELNLSQGVVEKKTTIPILSNVLVEAEKDRIILTATDLELGIRCSCAARVKKTGGGTIPARRLLDYVRLLQDGLLVPNQTAETVLDAGPLLVIDARRGFGQRMAADAVRRAIGRARDLGACVLALRNASHIGRIGTYAELAVRHGMAFIAFVNVADHRDYQAPYACAEPRLGTGEVWLPCTKHDRMKIDAALIDKTGPG